MNVKAIRKSLKQYDPDVPVTVVLAGTAYVIRDVQKAELFIQGYPDQAGVSPVLVLEPVASIRVEED